MLAPPPPTQFRELDGPVAERIGNLWRLATTDDQRWEIELLAQEIVARPEPEPSDDDVLHITAADWRAMRDDAAEAAAEAASDAIDHWKADL